MLHRVLGPAAGAIAALTLVLYQAWFIPFFQSFFAGRVEFARIVFYTLYGSLLLASGAAFVVRADIRRKLWPVVAVGALALALTPVHSVGLVTRAYVIAIVMGGATIVAMLASEPGTVLQVTAAVTALNALLCFVDLPFADGFTATVGRAAGLALNPNVAAAGIVLGAAASYRAVKPALQPAFLALIAGALVVTLSRSTILAAVAAALIPVSTDLARRIRSGQPIWMPPSGLGAAALLTVGMVLWVGVAAITNHRFRPVVQATAAASMSFVNALHDAHDSVSAVAQREDGAAVGEADDDQPAPGAREPTDASADNVAAATGARRRADSGATTIAAIDTRLSGEGVRNTISARTLFLERALLTYRSNPFLGMGLEAAHPLVPHNTFLLFALAFGHPGWLIPASVVALALYVARDVYDLPLPIAAVGTMLTSHDIFVTPSLFLPIAVGVGGIIGRESSPNTDRRLARSIVAGAAAAVALFLAGCVVIVRFTPPLTVERLIPSNIIWYRDAYYATLPSQTYPGLFVPAIEAGSAANTAFLRDDGEPLTRIDWRPGARPPVDPGEYVVRDGGLFFLPRTANDPRQDEHTIELGLPHAVGAPFVALVVTLVLWSIALVAMLRQSVDPSIAAARGVR